MGDRFKVKKLEELAFYASYMEILSNLSLCPEHRPEGNRNLASYSSILSMSPFSKGENVRQIVRNRLSQHLIGTFSDDIRQRYVKEFNQYMYDSDMKPSPWVFFDTVLDDSFTDLTVGLSSPGGAPDTKVLPVVASRSPNVTTLKLNFEFVKDNDIEGQVEPIILSLSLLNHLTSLSLDTIDTICKPYLMYLGNACPLLTRLSFSNSFLTRTDILNLLFGENAKTIDELDIDEEELHSYTVVDDDMLTPFTKTIECLELEIIDERSKLDKYHCKSGTISPPVMAFLLRHLPSLKSISSLGCTLISAIVLLSSSRTLNSSVNGEKSDTSASSDGAESSEDGRQSNLVCRSFEGTLSLSKIEFLDPKNYNTLQAVDLLCPDVREVLLKRDLNHSPDHHPISNGNVGPTDASGILSSWKKKLKTVTFCNISAVDREEILNILGSELHSLSYSNCTDITLKELSVCVKLEQLQILFASSLSSCTELPANEQFLPNLHTLESNICLGDYGRYFLERPGLLDIKLECCHLLKESDNWLKLIKMWPRVQSLKILSWRGLTMEMAQRLFTQMSSLKSLSLPYVMLYKKHERAASVIFKEKMESLKVAVSFDKRSWSSKCSLDAEPIEWEHSDNERSMQDDEMGGGIGVFHIPEDIDWGNHYEDYDDFDDFDDDDDDDDDYDYIVDDDDDYDYDNHVPWGDREDFEPF